MRTQTASYLLILFGLVIESFLHRKAFSFPWLSCSVLLQNVLSYSLHQVGYRLSDILSAAALYRVHSFQVGQQKAAATPLVTITPYFLGSS